MNKQTNLRERLERLGLTDLSATLVDYEGRIEKSQPACLKCGKRGKVMVQHPPGLSAIYRCGHCHERYQDPFGKMYDGAWNAPVTFGELTLIGIITDLIERIEQYKAQVDAADFWQSAYPEGMTAEDVRNELADYHTVLEEVGKVYCHVTGGAISKQNTMAFEVIGKADEYYQSIYEESPIC